MYIYDLFIFENEILSVDFYTFLVNNSNYIINNYKDTKKYEDNTSHYKYYKVFTIDMYKNIIDLCNKSLVESLANLTITDAIPPFKLLVSNISNSHYGIHRYGWKNVIQNFLKTTYNENNVFHYENPNFEWVQYALQYNLNTYNEAIYHFNVSKDNSMCNLKCICFDEWLENSLTKNNNHNIFHMPKHINIISFIHDPILSNNLDSYNFNDNVQCKMKETIFKHTNFKKIENKLKILITLSNNHKEHIIKNNLLLSTINTFTLLHPLESDLSSHFNIYEYLNNKEKKIYLIGWWLRKFDIFIKIQNNSHKKIILVKDAEGYWVTNYVSHEVKKILNSDERFLNLTREEKDETNPKKITNREVDFLQKKYNTHLVNFLCNSEYDNIFKNNIVFLDFYETSANNALLECITNNTPVLVNKLPAVIEYLGIDYPFYFTSLQEAETKLNDTSLIMATYYYLKNMSKERFTYSFFNKQLKNIIIENI
jgi:hypothetical protein